ncbi:DEAD/DEAH box helicase [Bacteroides heparinolyticus]|uniref:DEAD/DEAH box helicase n=2 Tax=Prevotella heparinolytica TaxID=28113 RepID=UPI00359F1D14
MYFDELNLNDNVLDALYDMHFDECTPVQEQCIPHILEGRDILAVAQTGTGKTAAYLLPVLSKLADGGYPEDAINCIIMSPTRELAQQIDQSLQGFAYYLQGISSVSVYGGNDGNRYDQELKSLSLGADVIIATPGRFISHLSLGNVDLSKVSFFILDEADRMLDMGFVDDIKTIAQKLPPTCQTIMFSATMPKKIEDLTKTLLKNPVEVKLAVSKPAEKIHQSAYVCYETQKIGIIKDIFKAGDLKRVIIFSGSKQKVKQIASSLNRKHINCGEMHSDLDQAQRDEMMFKFKSGQLDVLVATDIVARGIDIDDITMVINYDVPHDVEDYVHRIGRTARADRDGAAITFVNQEDIYYFQQIESFLDKTIEKTPLPEELGEGPEYKQAGKPSKGRTAKKRRTYDRNRQAHKDNKSKNRRQTSQAQERRSEQGKEAAKDKKEAAKDKEKELSSNNSNRQRNNKQPRNRKDYADPEAKEETKDSQKNTHPNTDKKESGNRKRSARRQSQETNSTANSKANSKEQEQRSGNTENKQNKKRPNKNNKKRNAGARNTKEEKVRRSTKYDIREELPNTKKRESGFKALIKKPLRWLGLSKK